MSFLTSNVEEVWNASFNEKENTSLKSTTEYEAERTSSLEEKEWECLIKETEDLKFKIKTLEQDKEWKSMLIKRLNETLEREKEHNKKQSASKTANRHKRY